MSNKSHELSQFIWSIADLLRGPYRPPQYERVMLPLVVLRRFDCVLQETKENVLAKYKTVQGKQEGKALDSILNKESGQRFHNHSPLDLNKILGDSDNVHSHLASYIQGFSDNVQKIFDRFEFNREIERMREHNILFLVLSRFANIDLHPTVVDNIDMGLLFEDLIRRFNEQANETAGDHFTPREVIRLMVNLLFIGDDELLSKPGTVRTMLDPTCGTGGMLAEARNYLLEHESKAKLFVSGQDFNPRSFAVAASDLLMKEDPKTDSESTIRFGDTLLDDQFEGRKFDYFLANPPFGVDWKRQSSEVKREVERLGMKGRFGAGTPRVNDGALLFLQHMVSKFEPVNPEKKQYGSRLAIVFNGSPLFTGGAGSGESDIRRWIIENDWLEAIIAMPEQMFYNTGIGTYTWIVTNRKEKNRRGKIQLIDARDKWQPLRRSLGDKRREFSSDHINSVVKEYGIFKETETSKIFKNSDFGYQRITVERPLRLKYQMSFERKEQFLEVYPQLLNDIQAIDKTLGKEAELNWNKIWINIQAILKKNESKWKINQVKGFRNIFTETDENGDAVILKSKGKEITYEADPKLRDNENVPLEESIQKYFEREVLPHVPDAWVDEEKTKIGYEINFNRYFYKFTPVRSLAEIDAELKMAEDKIQKLLSEVTE